MKHLRKFNESDESFKNPDDAIREFFIDYIDEDKESLNITNGWIKDDEFIWKADYIRKDEVDKYRKAKLVNLRISKSEGVSIGTELRCLTSLNPLKKAIQDIERFYDLSEEDINYAINTSDEFLEVSFVVKGGNIEESESHAEIIDSLLMELKTILNTKGFNYKRVTYKPNFLDIRTPVRDKNRDVLLTRLIRRVADGIETGESPREFVLPLVEWRNKVVEKGFSIEANGYDNQVVVKLKKV